MPDGANILDGTGSSSVSGLLSPRITVHTTMIADINKITTTAANAIDSVPWIKVFLITSSSWCAVFAEPNAVLPAALAAAYWKC